MSDIHHHHDATTVIEGDGPSTALIAVVVLMLVGFLIWLFAFSGVVFRSSLSTNQTNNNKIEAPANQQPGTAPGDNTKTQPSP